MVRITTISNILSGIGIAILAFSAILKYLLEGLGQTGTAYPFYAWIIGAGLLVIVILASAVNFSLLFEDLVDDSYGMDPPIFE